MGLSGPHNQRRQLPAGLRTQKGNLRESPTWRLRSRSYTPDHVLYRMGLRKNAQGAWDGVDNLVPAGMAEAMRAATIKSGTRIKSEPIGDDVSAADIGDADVGRAEPALGVRVPAPDMMDATAVLEEIRVYIDVDDWVEKNMGHKEEGEADGFVVQPVEIKTDFEMDTAPVVAMSRSESVPGADLDSLTSIPEEADGGAAPAMDRSPMGENAEQQAEITAATIPTAKRKAKARIWTEPEIHYLGALFDAGYTRRKILGLLRARFPEADAVSLSSIDLCRTRFLLPQIEHLKQSRLLGKQLGLPSGKWLKMNQLLENDLKWKLLENQETQRRTLKSHHEAELHEANVHFQASGHGSVEVRMRNRSRMHEMLIAQRTQWRTLMEQQTQQQQDFDVPESVRLFKPDVDLGEDQVVQLTMLIHETEERSILVSNDTPYVLPVEYQKQLKQELWRRYNENGVRTKRSMENELWYEYDMAKLFLEKKKWPQVYGSKEVLHKAVLDLLLLDEE